MIPVNKSFIEIVRYLENEFKNKNIKPGTVCLLGILFAQPQSEVSQTSILPFLTYYHVRSGESVYFFFPGYSEKEIDSHYGPISENFGKRKGSFIKNNKAVSEKVWDYSPEAFNLFRKSLEEKIKWEYSGDVDLLLTSVYCLGESRRAYIDFSSTLVMNLDEMLKKNHIGSINSLFEEIFKYAEKNMNSNIIDGLSNLSGRKIAKVGLENVLLLLLPEVLRDLPKKAAKFAVLNLKRKAMQTKRGT